MSSSWSRGQDSNLHSPEGGAFTERGARPCPAPGPRRSRVIAAPGASGAEARARPPPETTSKSTSLVKERALPTCDCTTLSARRPSLSRSRQRSRTGTFGSKQKPHRALSSVGSLLEDRCGRAYAMHAAPELDCGVKARLRPASPGCQKPCEHTPCATSAASADMQ